MKKFHNYLYGRHFTIESDHHPLSFLFNQAKGTSPTASSRIQRWALTLSAYHYSIRYKAGSTLSNADALSRLPRPVATTSDCLPGDLVHLVDHLSGTTVSAGNIREWTTKDSILSQVRRYTLIGWPDAPLGEEFKPYQFRSRELSVLDGCVLWGCRIVVPPQGRAAVLDELHETHPGASRMKALARSYIWWPKMDTEIEAVVKTCNICQESRPFPSSAPVHPWQWPSQPWSRLHLDFAGPFMGHMFLIIVDSHSKWLDAHVMSSITSTKTIEILRSVFATHGLPQKIVTDNGPSFTSQEFSEFMKANGIKHVTSAPYHPSTNGLAERGVQTLKQGIRRTKGSSIQEKVSKFLFNYRITPHSTTGIAPSELLMNRRLRSWLDLLHPEISRKVEAKQKAGPNKTVRQFSENDNVFVRNFSGKPSWVPGTILKVTGPLSYVIKLQDGKTVRRHVDHVRSREIPSTVPQLPSSLVDLDLPTELSQEDATESNRADPPIVDPEPNAPDPPPSPRRSTRDRRPPDRYNG